MFSLLFVIISIQSCDNPTSSNLEQNSGVIFTFDDHTINEWVKADSIFHQKNWKATFCVSQFPYLTEKEKLSILQLQNNGNEIACHGTHHERAVYYIKEHSVKEYLEYEIYPSLIEMEKYGIEVSSFAYPGGVRNALTDSVLFNCFSLLRGTTFRSLPPEQHKCFSSLNNSDSLVFALGIDSHYKHLHLAYIKTLLNFAKENRKIIIFYGHHICKVDSAKFVTSYKTIDFICNYVNDNNMDFYTLSDLIDN